MKPENSRVLAAIGRCFTEANNAILKLTAHNALNKVEFTYTGMSFFAIVDQALYNDFLAGAIRIFDDHKDAGTLWYIIRCNEVAAQKAADYCGISLPDLRSFANKLSHIRNKTHFHIDRKALDNPSGIWEVADISGKELKDALHDAAQLLAKIKQDVFGGEMETLTPYDGSDVEEIIEAFKTYRANK